MPLLASSHPEKSADAGGCRYLTQTPPPPRGKAPWSEPMAGSHFWQECFRCCGPSRCRVSRKGAEDAKRVPDGREILIHFLRQRESKRCQSNFPCFLAINRSGGLASDSCSAARPVTPPPGPASLLLGACFSAQQTLCRRCSASFGKLRTPLRLRSRAHWPGRIFDIKLRCALSRQVSGAGTGGGAPGRAPGLAKRTGWRFFF